MLFKWRDTYSCNIESIDIQHKKLFEIGSRLYLILTMKDGLDHYDEIIEIVEELKEYTIYHFKCEEELMEKYNYEHLDVHKEEHEAFINKIIEIQSQDIDEKQSKISLEMIEFIANWIEGHILKTDFKYKGYLNEKGVS